MILAGSPSISGASLLGLMLITSDVLKAGQIGKLERFINPLKIRIMNRQEAIAVAMKYGLEEEVNYYMDHGYSPEAALSEWDIL